MPSRLQSKTRLVDQRPVEFADWYNRTSFYPHDHDFYELVLITGGRGSQVSAAGTDPLTPGTLALLVPGVWHEFRDGDRLAGYDCFFSRTLLFRDLAWITDDPVLGGLLLRHAGSRFHRRPVIGRIDGDRLAFAQSLLRHVNRLPGEAVRDRRTCLIGVLAALLGLFAEAVRSQVLSEARPASRPGQRALTQRALALFAEDLTCAWTLHGLAGHLGTSRGVLIRAFDAVLGRSPMASFAHARMERAAAMLVAGDAPVGDIGAQVGILDANYFARRFRAEMGLTPSAYRQRFTAPRGHDRPELEE